MFRTLLAKELREQRRTHRMLIIVAVLLVSGLISPLLAKYTPLIMRSVPGVPPEIAALIPEPTIQDAFIQYFKNIGQFGLLLVIVLTMGIMAQEKERGTAAMLLTKPVRRSAVVLTKWLAGLLCLLAGLLLAALGAAFYTLVLFQPFSLLDFLAGNALLAIFLAFYMTLALLASTLARSQSMAAAGAFGGLLLALILDGLPVIGDYMPAQLLEWGGAIMAGSGEAAWGALAITCSLILLFLALACLRFEREEI
jgi:ABC-2 type transport system permease protein